MCVFRGMAESDYTSGELLDDDVRPLDEVMATKPADYVTTAAEVRTLRRQIRVEASLYVGLADAVGALSHRDAGSGPGDSAMETAFGLANGRMIRASRAYLQRNGGGAMQGMAQDIVQMVWLHLWRGFRFDNRGDERAMAFLIMLCRRSAARYIQWRTRKRRDHRQDRHRPGDQDEAYFFGASNWSSPMDAVLEHERDQEHKDLIEEVRRVLSDRGFADAFDRYWDKHVGAASSPIPGNHRTQVSRSREALRRLFNPFPKKQ